MIDAAVVLFLLEPTTQARRLKDSEGNAFSPKHGIAYAVMYLDRLTQKWLDVRP